MKKGGVVLGFAPMIIYGVLVGNSVFSVIIALVAATATLLIISWTDLRKRMMMAWVNAVIFGSALIAIGVLGIVWIVPYLGILIYATLASFTIGSILTGRPFTLQYAREMVDPSYWENR